MLNKAAVVNIYNFIRMSHVEPSRFITDDFETIQNEIITVKQYGFPGTYALKYDALMDKRYQELLKAYLDGSDEIGAWWEITEPLCRRAGVTFRGGKESEEYDDRVDSAYSIGYTPEERRKLVDAYMVDFYAVFGKYPGSIGSWVLDSVTIGYARERYGVEAAAICRDQMGVDGFTLWGGYPNGVYFPSRNNEFIPAQSPDRQLDIPVFRLLGPDPIYNFEADVRDRLQGVYTLEPSWIIGRNKKWISWFFSTLTEEDSLGIGYAQVGQENNFLWENIKPGLTPQLDVLRELHSQGKIRVETMAETARRFRKCCHMTPPMTFQASSDWDRERNLSCQWYACGAYRVGFLGEKGHLRIRDFFLFEENYASRYLEKAMQGTKSTFDALPVLFPQLWMEEERPFIRLIGADGKEPEGQIRYSTLDSMTARAELVGDGGTIASFTMTPDGIRLHGNCALNFDILPVFMGLDRNRILMKHEGFHYCMTVEKGKIEYASANGLGILPENGEIHIILGRTVTMDDIFTGDNPACADRNNLTPSVEIPPFMPEFTPGDSVFSWGEKRRVTITSREAGEIRYTLDGTEPTVESPLYSEPIVLSADSTVSARVFLPDGRSSNIATAEYRFGLKDMALLSATRLDWRPQFHGNGMEDLLGEKRGSLDYLDGQWRGTLENMDVTCVLAHSRRIRSISLGFLSHHRSGIVYPEAVELYTGKDAEHLTLFQRIEIPNAPGKREIEKMDVAFTVNERIGAFRIIARRYARMPQWCTYRGTETVFTMADNLIVTPEE